MQQTLLYNSRTILTLWLAFFVLTLTVALPAQASGFQSLFGGDNQQESEFLPVEEAFQVSATLNDRVITVRFDITPKHYLYRHMFSFAATDPATTQLGQAVFPAGLKKYDKFLEQDVEIYPETMSVQIPAHTASEFPEISVTFQGCAEAGLCYPPTTVTLIPVAGSTADGQSVAPSPGISDSGQSGADPDGFLSALLAGNDLASTLLLFFAAGLALTFTPCVLPMIPIVSAMVANSQASRSHNVLLTLCYVLAMSATYAVAGMLMGYFGASLNLQARLQSPWLLIPFAILFAGLALSMFGLYELQLPEKLRDRLTRADQASSEKRKGTFIGAALAGIFSTLLVSPCVSAPLAGALVYISSTEDIVAGGLSLFVLGLGMGTPLFIIGAGGAGLLPRAGQWMDGIKAVFGVMLLAVAVWMLERLLPGPVTLLLWGALAIGSAVYLGALDFRQRGGWPAFRQVLGLLLLIYGATLVIGGIKGENDPLHPLGRPGSSQTGTSTNISHGFQTITSSQALNQALLQARQANRPVMLDFYADWCISCKIFEREVLPQPEVTQALQDFSKLRIDLTDNTVDQRSILSKYNLFGPPAFIFINNRGKELENLRHQGEISADRLVSSLKKAAKD